MTLQEPNVNLIDEREVVLLDVGAGTQDTAQFFFPNATVLRLDADPEFNSDYVHDIREPFPDEIKGKFDIVFLSHVLEHIDRALVHDTVMGLKSCLKDGGELWIIVPSLEWVGHELTKDRPSPVTIAALYGSQTNEWQYHKTGFTLFHLRTLIEKVGMIPRQAYQGPFTVTMGGKDFQAVQNIVVAKRWDANDWTLRSENGSEPEGVATLD
jgi:SAM-dependent methyltransferase